jgi:hypothetical protein
MSTGATWCCLLVRVDSCEVGELAPNSDMINRNFHVKATVRATQMKYHTVEGQTHISVDDY